MFGCLACCDEPFQDGEHPLNDGRISVEGRSSISAENAGRFRRLMHGHMVIADISGYTRFLTESELDHANGIISELLNAVIGAIQAPLTVSGIEGDAVFMYGAMPEGMSGQTVLESVELLYYSFASALETMVLNTTCQCNACANIHALGLKIVMHCGEFAKSEIGGRETLSGPDVILTHRLLKNSVAEATGIVDYMLVTQACADDLKIQRIVASWTAHTEEYEHVGEVNAYVSSLSDIWSHFRRQNENKVLQRDSWVTATAFSEAPPAVVWDHLVDPSKRTKWLQAVDTQVVGEVGGRIAPGAEYHCAHGDDTFGVFTVLDMKALDYITMVAGIGEARALRYTEYVIPSGTGTRLVSYTAPVFSVESGESLSDDELAEFAGTALERSQESLNRLCQMADIAAASLTSV